MSAPDNKGPASAGPAFDHLARATQAATGLILILLVVLVVGEAFLRGAFNYSLGFAEELTGYCVVMLTFFGAALALRRGALFQVHFLYDKIPDRSRALLTRLFVIVALGVTLVLMWKTGDLVMSSLERGKFAPTVLQTPLWIPQLLMPSGFLVIGIFLAEQFLLTFKSGEDA